MKDRVRLKAAAVSTLLLAALVGVWYLATLHPASPLVDSEYARLVGSAARAGGESGMPTPMEVGARLWQNLRHPFYYNGNNDQGIGYHLGYSLMRVAAGYLMAAIVGIPLGFLIGMSPLFHRALNPFVQILRPVSPLAWLPLALYTIKDAGVSAIFVIFICSIWPMMLNTAFGVAGVRQEWLKLARTLEVRAFRLIRGIILPAALPAILTGMRISIGIAWLVIVAAEMIVGGTGIGYYIWNQWNILSIGNIVTAVLLIGFVGMLLDQIFGLAMRLVAYQE